MKFRRKCAKCGRMIAVEAPKSSFLKGKLMICGGPRETDGCWQGINIVKKRSQTVGCIMGRRTSDEV